MSLVAFGYEMMHDVAIAWQLSIVRPVICYDQCMVKKCGTIRRLIFR